MVAAFKFSEHIQTVLTAGSELIIHKGSGTDNDNNIYLNLYADGSVLVRQLVISTSAAIFILGINETDYLDPIPVTAEVANTTAGFQLDFSKSSLCSFASIKLQGGSADAVLSVFVC